MLLDVLHMNIFVNGVVINNIYKKTPNYTINNMEIITVCSTHEVLYD